ncbi:MAG: tRNA dihydrouridine(20/20a) synthase DusA [Burkholderiaceae bacterium]
MQMPHPTQLLSHRLCVAPMMDWTDRHCRYFHRLLAPNALLYTEMVTTGAILHGDLERLLGHDASEHPLALQIGGSEPQDLARAARVGAQWGYQEINLNCGCPSERVQKGAFGACLMNEPALVAQGVQAMRDAVDCPVTVKHRIGVDQRDDYGFVRDFVGTVAEAGCSIFIVHARSAILKGLSPKENREVPPLRYSVVRHLKRDFPNLTFVLNGGLTSVDSCQAALVSGEDGPALDGVMLGRAAYHDPWILRDLDAALFGMDTRRPDHREAVLDALDQYLSSWIQRGVAAKSITRHWHGLLHGQPGARQWRRSLCEGESPLAVWRRHARMAKSTTSVSESD